MTRLIPSYTKELYIGKSSLLPYAMLLPLYIDMASLKLIEYVLSKLVMKPHLEIDFAISVKPVQMAALETNARVFCKQKVVSSLISTKFI